MRVFLISEAAVNHLDSFQMWLGKFNKLQMGGERASPVFLMLFGVTLNPCCVFGEIRNRLQSTKHTVTRSSLPHGIRSSAVCMHAVCYEFIFVPNKWFVQIS